MIKSIKIANFCSIGKVQEISFLILPSEVLDESAVEVADCHLNLVNCFIGHNASGKTTVLKAISFLFWLMSSYASLKSDEPIPVDAHKFFSKKLTKIEIEFFDQKRLFKYQVELDRHHIQREFLGEKVERGYTRVFEYTRTAHDWDFKSSPKIKINKNDLARFKERKNISVLSSLMETGYLPKLAFVKNFESNVTDLGERPWFLLESFFRVSQSLQADEILKKEVQAYLRDVDLSIFGFEFAEGSLDHAGETKKIPILECVHQSSVGTFKLPLFKESNGTGRSLELLTKVIAMLKEGGILVLDEIESGLHPYIIKKIISLFESKATNPHHAQLIFSTHQHWLLNDRTKTQIFITEKDNEYFETEVFRLDDVEGIRNDENYFQKYLAGAYGGVPHIKWVRT